MNRDIDETNNESCCVAQTTQNGIGHLTIAALLGIYDCGIWSEAVGKSYRGPWDRSIYTIGECTGKLVL